MISGLAASALHAARWVDQNIPIEINLAHNKSPRGVLVRRDTLRDDEIVQVRGMAVTSGLRTAFDLARRGPVGTAVARLDALARATNFKTRDVLAISANHLRVRGRRHLLDVLNRVDEGAQSPKETWLRLLLIEAGFPCLRTQIPVWPDGYPRYFLDMGWEDFMVTAEYDGEQQRVNTDQYRGDVRRAEYVASLGWRRIAVLAGDRGWDIIRRVEAAGVPRNRR